jgi:hypothetical protein
MMPPDNPPLGHSASCATLLIASSLCAGMAQAATVEIYRCAGTPAVYTSDLRLVRAGRCTPLGAAPAAARSSTAVTPVPRPVATVPPAGATIARDVQQQRDSDRVHILQTEQARERDRLTQLTQQLHQLQSAPPEVASARHAETVALSQAIQRSESDLQALDKELARAQR